MAPNFVAQYFRRFCNYMIIAKILYIIFLFLIDVFDTRNDDFKIFYPLQHMALLDFDFAHICIILLGHLLHLV